MDYTGRSGADALVVVLDRVRGKGRKTWTLPTEVGCIEYGQRLYQTERVWGNSQAKFLFLMRS